MPSSTPAADPSPRSTTASSTKKPSSSYSLLPRIPAPLQRLFDSVPLVTYPANHLPARSPAQDGELPVLYVFTTAEDAARGRPSFNPSCLKWQTYLKITQTPFRTAPSSNHASPTGSLPYLQPLSAPTTTTSSSSTTTPPSKPPIPSSKLTLYAASLTHTSTPPAPLTPTQKAHRSLLETRIRPAWLHTLYLVPSNTPLLRRLYAAPASSTYTVQAALLHQLRHAARGEIRRSATLGGSTWSGEDDEEALYESARKAFAALEVAIVEEEGRDADLFDASVFAYTHLLLDTRLGWGDRRLGLIVEEFPGLVRHRERILRRYYGDDVADIGDSATWEKL